MKIRRNLLALLPSIGCLVFAPIASADDPPVKEGEKPGEPAHMMMDHSKGDLKSMSRMKRKNMGNESADAHGAHGDGKDNMMMDHSKGDMKSMSRMKDKKIPIHHDGDPSTAKVDGKEHMMMDHSKGDMKSMSRMKDRKIPTHKHSDAAAGDGSDSTPKSDK